MGLGFFGFFLGFFGIGIFWVFLGFFGIFWVFKISKLGLGFFGIGFFWDWDFLGFFGIFWDFLGFLNSQIGIGFFWDWDFLGFFGVFFGFFGFSLYFLNLKLVLVFFCFLTIIYGNIHNRVLASA